MIRLILVLLFIVVFLILSIPVQLVLRLLMFIPAFVKPVKRVSLAIVSNAFKGVAWLSGVRLTIKGSEHIPADQAVLYVGNHRSYYDIVIMYSLMKKLTGFIAKKEIKLVPVLNIWMWFLDCLFLDRDDLKSGVEMIKTATDNMKDGVSYVIFPEGTRNGTDEEFLPFHKGSFKIAQRSGCAIIPVALTGTREIYEANKRKVKSSKVILEYGEPLYYNELTRDEQRNIDEVVLARIRDMYRRNGGSVVQTAALADNI